MNLLLDLEIYAWIRRYLRGAATVDEFEDWFVSETWDVEHTGNVAASEVAADVRASLTELSVGEMDEDAFRAHLRSLEARHQERIRIFQLFARDQSEDPLSETLKVGTPAGV